jgi:hypothetical protein
MDADESMSPSLGVDIRFFKAAATPEMAARNTAKTEQWMKRLFVACFPF